MNTLNPLAVQMIQVMVQLHLHSSRQLSYKLPNTKLTLDIHFINVCALNQLRIHVLTVYLFVCVVGNAASVLSQKSEVRTWNSSFQPLCYKVGVKTWTPPLSFVSNKLAS